MWYKKAYPDDTLGASDSLDVKDEFRDFYDDELEKHPKDAEGLAMFSPHALGLSCLQYFHSSSDWHLHFFDKIGAASCSKPEIELFCLLGDCDYF